MIEIKRSMTNKVNIKSLTVSDGNIVDADGVIKDLNKIVSYAFSDGDVFDFTVTNKNDDTEIVEEDSADE